MPPGDRQGGGGRGGRGGTSALGGRGSSAEPTWRKPTGGALSAKAKKEYLQWKRSQKREQGDVDSDGDSGADAPAAQHGGGAADAGRRTTTKAALQGDACLKAQQKQRGEAISSDHGVSVEERSEVSTCSRPPPPPPPGPDVGGVHLRWGCAGAGVGAGEGDSCARHGGSASISILPQSVALIGITLVITRGKEGVAVFSQNSDQITLIPTIAKEVYDVSGAGDRTRAPGPDRRRMTRRPLTAPRHDSCVPRPLAQQARRTQQAPLSQQRLGLRLTGHRLCSPACRTMPRCRTPQCTKCQWATSPSVSHPLALVPCAHATSAPP